MMTLKDLETRINQIYAMAISCRHTADNIHTKLNAEVYAELNRRYKSSTLPKGRLVYSSYMRGYAFGIVTAHNTYIMRNLVEFCYRYDGKLYSTRRDSIHPYWADTLDGKTVSLCCGNFYWKGTDKNYTV